jgi:hypothetical protein
MNPENRVLINQLEPVMQLVFIVLSPLGYVLGVFASLEAAQDLQQSMGDDCTIVDECIQY